MPEECIFCKIAKGEIPSYKIYESNSIIAFLDINPVARAHSLVIPKRHVEKIYELSREEAEDFLKALETITKAISKSQNIDAFNYLVNQGREAGQIIEHFHMHIIPRKQGDGIEFNFEKHLKMSDNEFKELAERIRKAQEV